MTFKKISESKCFNGVQGIYSHFSEVCGCEMRFGVFTPPEQSEHHYPVVFWLSGLTCTEENFIFKAGAQRYAAELGLMLIIPDTSPRGLNLPGEDADYDFGSGAGFYLDATEHPWAPHYKMYSYITEELHGLILSQFKVSPDKVAISGHSMGGHGALTIGLRNPEKFKSISAFSPIVSPTSVPWGQKVFERYLGANKDTWDQYDAVKLLQNGIHHEGVLFVDQGEADEFLKEQLKPEILEATCKSVGQELMLRMHPGYDHSYYFISTFIGEHLSFHSKNLKEI